MALSSNETAILAARCGAARCGAIRCGFTPRDTVGTTPGTSGPFYQWWQRVYQAAATWTLARS